ncbi:hypothetical protein BCR42DRAFT_441510 [Absidia repens]|uniref:DNA 3'-5' helicase n=1 Tax=Absidia repens TaxID=90262 RepID=A0A1X2I5S6_9FUNG|nr:hypothetical protein BCR42DRAFT_441510 [Absidia repens]
MWTSSEQQYTNSQTNGWLEEEEAFLDQFTSKQQESTNAYTVQSIEGITPTNRSFNYCSTKTFLPPNPDYGHQTANTSSPLASTSSNHLRSVMEIPKEYQPIFKYSYFNRMQSEAMDQLLHSNENIVVSAPTGTGKTVLLEMAMIRCLLVYQTQQNYQQGSIKMIYMAPTKSLCAEKVAHWKNSFGPLGIVCEEFTGDSDYATIDSIKNSNIIVTTPEKWDSMTRRWIDHRRLVEMIKLLMIDEIHILKETRGATLEVCVSRMKAMDHGMRIVAVSATIPNLQDITTWLNASALTFSEEYRPIFLERYVYGYPSRGTNSYAFEKSLDWKLLDIIVKHGDNKSVLIFCSTRTATQSACDTLLKLMDRKNITLKLPNDNVELKNKKLYGFVQRGIGFHHAGLDSTDRHVVEQLFLSRKIGIVATTSTLAVGVNLPAHLVIIKSTKGYQNGGLEEYSDIDILQMIGRAGRPGLDTSGCAVIMTTSDMEHKFKSLISCQSVIESSLHRNLTEHLMSEICIGTVVDMDSSTKWLGSTFLYVRVKQNSYYYQQLYNDESLTKNPNQVMKDICLKDMKLLIDHNLVSVFGEGYNAKYEPTFYGSTMDRYYVQFKTMVKIMQSKNWCSIKDVLELVSQSEEFETYRYNAHEKTILNDLRSNADIRFPLKNKVSDVSDKVYVMIQCVLGEISLYHPLIGNLMNTASHMILQKACIIDCSAYEKDAIKLKHSLDLYRCMQAKMWSTSPFILKQIDGIGIQIAKSLSQRNISSFEQLRDCDPGQLEMILHRNPPFGTKIHSSLSFLPQYYLDLKQKPKQKYQSQPIISLSVSIETSDHDLVDFRRIKTENLSKRHSELNFDVKVTSPSMTVICHLQSEDYVGLDVMKQLKPNVDPTQFITLTDPIAHSTPAPPLIPVTLQPTITTEQNSDAMKNDKNASLDTWIDALEDIDDSKTIKAEPSTPRLKKKSTRSKKTDNEPCKHHCKDKQSCKHQCCKRATPLEDNRITSYPEFSRSFNNNSTSPSNKQISTSSPTDSSNRIIKSGSSGNGNCMKTQTPSHQPIPPPPPEHVSHTMTNRNHGDDDNFLDHTLLNSRGFAHTSLSPSSVSMKIEDEDTWDITDTSMDDVLCNMTITAEKNQQEEHMHGDNDCSMFGDLDMDMENEPLQDYFLCSTATSDAPSCDLIWADLEQAIYDADKRYHGDGAIQMDTNGNDDGDIFDLEDTESIIGHDAQTSFQENATRLPNLIKWINDHVETIVE